MRCPNCMEHDTLQKVFKPSPRKFAFPISPDGQVLENSELTKAILGAYVECKNCGALYDYDETPEGKIAITTQTGGPGPVNQHQARRYRPNR